MHPKGRGVRDDRPLARRARRVLNISNNLLTTLPMELGLCQNLEVLSANNNLIESVPSHLSDCKNLRVLDLKHNQITVLPIELCYIKKLQILLLADNHVIMLPDLMDRLTELLTLDVSHNRLRRLPASLGACAKLSTINVEGNPELQIRDQVLAGGPTAIKAYLLTVTTDATYIEMLMEELVAEQKAQQRAAREGILSHMPTAAAKDLDAAAAELPLQGRLETAVSGDKALDLERRQAEARRAAEEMRARLAADPRLERQMLATKKQLQREFRAQVEYTRAVLSLKDFTYGANPINALNKARKTNVLDLKSMGLKTLIPEIATVKAVTALDLRNNHLTTCGNLLDGMKFLQILDVSMNLLESLHESTLPALEHFAANTNRLTEVPESLAKSVHLRTLSLCDNQLMDLPPALDNAPIETLLLANNLFATVPVCAQASTTLRKLSLAANQVSTPSRRAGPPRASSRPPCPGPTTAPVSCLLTRGRAPCPVQISELPEDLSLLANLEALDVSFNRITELPMSMSSLRALRHLNVGFNPLGSAMPEVIPALKRLVTLNLDFTGVQQVPPLLGNLSDLVELGMEGNALEQPYLSFYHKHPLLLVHVFNEKVTHLDLSKCELVEVPEYIGRLTALRNLDLSDNLIVELHDGLGELAALTALKLDGNPLARLWNQIRLAPGHSDLDVVAFLNPRAPEIDLSKCGIMDLPAQLQPHARFLGSLNLNENRLAVLPSWLPNFSALHTILLGEARCITGVGRCHAGASVLGRTSKHRCRSISRRQERAGGVSGGAVRAPQPGGAAHQQQRLHAVARDDWAARPPARPAHG